MALSDPIGDLLTRIRNGQRANLPAVNCRASKLRAQVLRVLEQEGFIRGFSEEQEKGKHAELRIELKYFEGQSAIRRIDRVSKPGRRVYTKIKDLQRHFNGLGVTILSTPMGVMSDQQARAANVGGEILCRVF